MPAGNVKADETKKKRRDLTIQERMDIIVELERCDNVSATARAFNTTRRHVQKIQENKQAIMEAFYSSTTSNSRKRLHKSASTSSVQVTPKHRKKQEKSTPKHKKKPEKSSQTLNKLKVEVPDIVDVAVDHSVAGSLEAEDIGGEEAAPPHHEPQGDGTQSTHCVSAVLPSSSSDSVPEDTERTEPKEDESIEGGQQAQEIDSIAKDLQSSASEFVYRDPPSISVSIQTPGSVDTVKALEAAESLLNLNAEQIVGKSNVQGTTSSRVVHFDLPTTIDYLNSPPDNKTNPATCHACSLQSQVQPAKKFCTDCKQHFCIKHVELHRSLVGDSHVMVESSQIQPETANNHQDKVKCEHHVQNTIISGCDNCTELFCVDCLCWLNSKEESREALYPCSQGRRHEPFPLMKLEQRLKRKAVGNLENKLQESKDLQSAAQTKLREAISTLHTQRDKEREELEVKSKKLEEKFRKLEEETRASFGSEVKLEDLDKLVTSLETKMRSITDIDPNRTRNPAVVIAEYRQVIADGQNWITSSLRLPQYEWRDIKSEEGPDSCDWIEIKPPPSLGTCLTDIKLDINESKYTHRLCHYRDMTYISYRLSDRVVSVDESGTVSNIITLDKDSGYSIRDIAVNNDKIFVLTYNDYIRVYSLTGELITTWELCESCTSITLSGDLLVISTYGDGLLLIYTEEGEKITQPHTRLDIQTLFPADSKSVIACYKNDNDDSDDKGDNDENDGNDDNDGSFTVCRVDIRTGGIMWRREDIDAWSAVYDCHGNLLIWTQCDDLHILDISTGETLKFVSKEDIYASLGYKLGVVNDSQLGISGETLIILCEVSFKQISTSSSDNSDDETDEEYDCQKEFHLFKLQLGYPDRQQVD